MIDGRTDDGYFDGQMDGMKDTCVDGLILNRYMARWMN